MSPFNSMKMNIRQTDDISTADVMSTRDDDDLPNVVDTECFTTFPNGWSRLRHIIREPAAEFIGTMILVLFGTAGNAQGVLFNNPNVSSSPAGDWMSVALGWGLGIDMVSGIGFGALVSGSTSGGHINPAISIALATFRGFPWKKVPIFIIAQLFGGIVGAAITYANYFHAISLFEGGPSIRTVPGTASLFGAYAAPYLSDVSAFWDEFLGTFILLIVLLSVTDKRNGPGVAGFTPLALFFTLFGIGMTFGAQTGFAVNPARDLGPRIFTAMAGYGRGVFNFRHQYWLWCGVLAPILGALVATFLYDLFMYTGSESLLNRPNEASRSRNMRSPDQECPKMPAGASAV